MRASSLNSGAADPVACKTYATLKFPCWQAVPPEHSAKALSCVCSYAGGYWEARAAAALGQAHAWQGCMDIMGKGL